MSDALTASRTVCPLCGARIPYRRRLIEFWSTHPGQPVLVLCDACGRFVQDRRHVYWWRLLQWLLIALPLGLYPAKMLMSRWPTVQATLTAVTPGGAFWIMWIIVIVVGGLFGMPCLLRFTHAADDELCRKCGYDLRGSLGLVCPECGGRREATARRTEASSPENVATREAGWR